jgi:histidyl-tRNA synthetase
MGKALEDADKRKVDYAVIVGERELKEGAVMLRNLAKREQTIVPIKELMKKFSY